MKHQPTKKFPMANKIQSNIAGCLVAMSFLGAATCANAQLLNGTLDTTFYGSPLYVQTVNTQFGNSAGGGDATGSELDAVYAKVSGGNLYLFIAGCFQNNGNHLNVFIAGGGPGQNTLNVSPSTEAAMNGSIFASGFNATYMIDANDSSGTLYVDGFPLPNGSQATQAYLGPVPLTDGIGSTTFGSTTFALNNTLTSTMGTAGQALSGSTVGASVTTGLEIVIPTSAIGYTGGSVNVLIDINGGGNGYLSNQFLPGLPVPSNNLGGSTFNFGPAPTPTNYVTFQLDMSAQVFLGTFTNGTGGQPASGNSITVSGDFEGWDNGLPLTNNPALTTVASNIYSGTFPAVGFTPDTINYKFRMNGGWESPASTGGNNRQATIGSGTTPTAPQVLPLVYYNDEDVYDLCQNPITVNFTLYCPDGTVDVDGYAFMKGIDTLWINGDWIPWWTWNPLGTGGQAGYQLSEVGSSDYYTNSFVIPKGNPLALTYKYSVDGADNENGFATNHLRYIRSYGPTYTFPTDQWSYVVCPPGTPYPNPGITATNIQEPNFGYLTIGAPSGGNFPITWLGRPGVLLENRTSLSSGIWNPNIGTDATQSTNWPNAGGSQFFRLMHE
jgi:hypothetical protein